jgi:hypothetical protein
MDQVGEPQIALREAVDLAGYQVLPEQRQHSGLLLVLPHLVLQDAPIAMRAAPDLRLQQCLPVRFDGLLVPANALGQPAGELLAGHLDLQSFDHDALLFPDLEQPSLPNPVMDSRVRTTADDDAIVRPSASIWQFLLCAKGGCGGRRP